MASKERHFERYWEKNAQFSTPCNAEEYTQKDWKELYHTIFNAGWNARKDVEYHQAYSGSETQ